MKKANTIIAILLLSFTHFTQAQKIKTDANIIGHVTSAGEHLPFASIGLKGATLGTVSDETGHYQMVNLPIGNQTIVVSIIGYKPQEKTVNLEKEKTIEVNFDLEEDVLHLEEVVVSADLIGHKRTGAPVIVNTISPELLTSTQSITLGEGLNFTPGLRLENNCQNCGFSQVRMNGMEGQYSQILINSRAIFSGLAGVYGLELIPSNMIERVEVVRGGGSALYGSNAIAGTINIIMKEPRMNSYEGGANFSLMGVGAKGSAGTAPDYSVNFNTSIVSDDLKSGISLYGFTRKRKMFDANDDTFSEVTPLRNLTFGSRAFHRFGYRDILSLDFFVINEKRDGGNKQDYPLHERDIAEALTHNLLVAGLTYERYFREIDMLSVYGSGQFLNRDSYYGANQSLSDYGNTKDQSYNVGMQYKANLGISTLIGGIESTGNFLTDKKLGYPEYTIINDTTIETNHIDNTIIADQSSITNGLFAQYEVTLNKFRIVAGVRFDHFTIKDLADGGTSKSGNVISPRLSFMYSIRKSLQARISYSQGYRAPQIFDEDLHIEASGSRRVIHVNSPDLKQETSHSIMASLDYNRLIGTVYTSLLVEGFYTKLVDAFANEYGTPDENGTVIYTRVNANGGAFVSGVNLELSLKPLKNFTFTSGFTLQTSQFEDPQDEFNEKKFFRTPNQYGFFALDWDLYKNFCLTANGVYTGSMLVPYFGPANPEGELRKSPNFYDMGAKLSYTYKLNGASVEFSAGIKNIFNSYQNDFDTGINRDPAYIYGPLLPRTIYFGIRFGNLL